MINSYSCFLINKVVTMEMRNQLSPVKRICVFEHSAWQILTAHAQPFRGTRDLAFCLKVPLDALLIWASSEGSGETARMRRLAWTFAARIGYKYQIRLTRSNCTYILINIERVSKHSVAILGLCGNLLLVFSLDKSYTTRSEQGWVAHLQHVWCTETSPALYIL